mmetsp:Transcript_19848/g.45094  ORF Transcript_19848/g.45094 Transcript_19848/m.45094 type:complete len:349 (+) Transcript_19848:37-1083(+)
MLASCGNVLSQQHSISCGLLPGQLPRAAVHGSDEAAPRWCVGFSGLASPALAIFARRTSRRPARSTAWSAAAVARGVEVWRALPAQLPPNEMLRNAYNDIVMEELDQTPFRALAVIRVPIDYVPDVGFERVVTLPFGSLQHASAVYADREHGGFIGCAVNIPQAEYLPRGCVGAEILNMQNEKDAVRVTLRGIGMLRIIDRVCQPDAYNGCVLPIVQEVVECGEMETEHGVEALQQDIQRVEDLFVKCGELQRSTGIWAAGDLASKTVAAMTNSSVRVMADVQLCGVIQEGHRWPVLASHAAVAAFGRAKRSEFLCDPTSALQRIRLLNKFLTLMQRVLTQKLRAKQG